MSVLSRVLSRPGTVNALGDAATGVAEVFTINKTRRMERSFDAQEAALEQHQGEFGGAPSGRFDRFVNGLNRLPRPLLALGTLGLFVYAMVEPAGFGRRMEGLGLVPEPLWWLLGAIVSFYFGARELHYFRTPSPQRPSGHRISAWRAALPQDTPTEPASDNAALLEWQSQSRS